METRTPLMKVENLTKYYPVEQGIFAKKNRVLHAVDQVNFAIYEGETLGLVGESGCGKSTIGRLLVGLEEPTGGQILRNCKPLEVQMVFQDSYSSLNPKKLMRDILAYPMLYHKVCSKSQIDREIDRLLDMVGLPSNAKDRYSYEFSGGQRQRLGIAKALSLNPRLIICDEPVSALDVSIQAQILNLFQDIQKELGLSYLFIGHGLDAVNYVSDRIAVMYLGKIMELAPGQDLKLAPVHPYTKALYSASPIPDPAQKNRERILLEGELPSSIELPSGCRFHTRCPYAMDQCREQEPELLPVKGNPAHLSACFLERGED